LSIRQKVIIIQSHNSMILFQFDQGQNVGLNFESQKKKKIK